MFSEDVFIGLFRFFLENLGRFMLNIKVRCFIITPNKIKILINDNQNYCHVD